MSESDLPPLTRCECSRWYYISDGKAYGTGCDQGPKDAKRTFAQGHDTKLAGLRIRATKAGTHLRERR